MGVAVLPPQDFLTNNSRRTSYTNAVRSNRKRRTSPPRVSSTPLVGPIRILKRGEAVDLSPPAPVHQIRPTGSDLPGPAPLPDGYYAGSAFVTSPPPSSLPLPVFFTGRRNCGVGACDARDMVAESVLRRALKLQ